MEFAIDFQFLFAVLLAKLKLIKNTCTGTDFIQNLKKLDKHQGPRE